MLYVPIEPDHSNRVNVKVEKAWRETATGIGLKSEFRNFPCSSDLTEKLSIKTMWSETYLHLPVPARAFVPLIVTQ